MPVHYSFTFDTANPRAEAEFWAAALGVSKIEAGEPGEDGADEWASLSDPTGAIPTVFFQKVPEAKTAKNRLHLDIDAGGEGSLEERRSRIDAEVARLKALGATNQRGTHAEGQAYWVRMNDPEGNEFCVV